MAWSNAHPTGRCECHRVLVLWLKPAAKEQQQQQQEQQQKEELADENPAAERQNQDDYEEYKKHSFLFFLTFPALNARSGVP
jgi:hypothetical protein